MRLTIIFLIIAILIVGIASYLLMERTDPIPDNTISSNEAALDLTSEYAQQHKTLLTKAYQENPNFNGHYVITSVGCGTGCFTYVVLDKQTGQTYPLPVANDLGDSQGVNNPFSLTSDRIKVVVRAGTQIETYAFSGNSFMLVSTENL